MPCPEASAKGRHLVLGGEGILSAATAVLCIDSFCLFKGGPVGGCSALFLVPVCGSPFLFKLFQRSQRVVLGAPGGRSQSLPLLGGITSRGSLAQGLLCLPSAAFPPPAGGHVPVSGTAFPPLKTNCVNAAKCRETTKGVGYVEVAQLAHTPISFSKVYYLIYANSGS